MFICFIRRRVCELSAWKKKLSSLRNFQKKKCPGMTVNKNEEQDTDQETELRINTGNEMLLVALVFICACIIYHIYFISLILNSSDI